MIASTLMSFVQGPEYTCIKKGSHDNSLSDF